MAAVKSFDDGDNVVSANEQQLQNSVSKIQLTWENLHFSVIKKISRKKFEEIPILKGISGQANPGELLVIMGTSGAGKSSLMSVLNGSVISSKTRTLEGDIKANGVPISELKFNMIAGNVLQDDILLQNMTVRECIQFSADLRTNLAYEKRKQRVDQLLKDLRLTKVENSLIGSSEVRGISGGEKKRVCIGIELVTNPSVLFLDEPTSGLDSFTALAIVNLMKDQASLGRTVICTLHQPSSQIVELMDSLVVMTEGHIVFHNSPLVIQEWFEQLGFEFPEIGNPVDYLMHIISKEDPRFPVPGDKTKFLKENYESVRPAVDKVEEDEELKQNPPKQTSIWNQFKYLLIRSCKDTFRSKTLLHAKVWIAVFLASIMDMLYYKLGLNERGIQNRNGFFFIFNIVLFLSGIIQVILTFPLQRAVFLKEQSAATYNTHVYYWTKIIPEFFFEILTPTIFFLMNYWALELNTTDASKPAIFWILCVLSHISGGSIGLLLGCLVQNMQALSIFLPMALLPNIVLSGFLANLDSIPVPIKYLTYISMFRYAYTGMTQNEYRGLTFDCQVDPLAEGYPCDPLGDINIDLDLWANIVLLIGINVIFRVSTSFALKGLVGRIYS